MTITARAALAVALALGAAVPHATAATIAAGYYMEQRVNSCAQRDLCFLNFSAVPAGKTLILTDVSCTASVGSGSVLVATQVARSGDGDHSGRRPIPPVFTYQNGQDRNYQLQTKTMLIVQAGQVPWIATNYSAKANSLIVDCTIAGVLK
ncbi:hypothetical protein [Oharaeibacter diazotrophicus]|uniref:Invasion protein IalB n=1 Tax=Oharaeibacter diazotrophicus TaxID=1920512 RepID=A0A4R6RDW0_9HYPH|nr:hypothetical protein [Oharaeibacter diazotrophicus]TDP84389.1 hypothetical protein EDD54_2996 [Oharaeibacter diazotrophicus]BBE73427.1 hypothetical protein OHA_1_03038 [Pleomorphomonas sp. SM30]GLS75218.1 hypothetical protein GCM10007904_05530 [Oharaeibacter diazotrophicus]